MIKFQLQKFNKGSVPSLEGSDYSDSFYIVKKGQFIETTTALPPMFRKEDSLNQGDFFGIISCMARRPRLHTVEAIEDSLVINVPRNEFNALIQQNTQIALKIIRSFSRKLRYYDTIFSRLSFRSSEQANAGHLFEIGEYYFSRRMYAHHAAYAYTRFLMANPQHPKRAEAEKKLDQIKKNFQWDTDPRKDGYYRIYDDNRIIFLENEAGNALYIIQQGEVRITKINNKHEILLNILKPGDIFGEMAILENKSRNANAISSGQVKLIAVSKDNFESIVKIHPEIAYKIIELLSDRIWFIHQQISTIMISDPVTRLFDALYIHLLKDRININQGGPHTFDLTWEDILKFTSMQSNEGYRALEETIQRSKDFKLIDKKIHCKNIRVIEERMNLIRKKLDMENQE